MILIFLRRFLTVPLALVLTVVLATTLVAHRVTATVLSPDFLHEQLVAIGVFDAVHDEVLPAALEDFLAEQEEKIPDNLEGVTLPTDEASQETMLAFARETVPPEFLDGLSEGAIAAVVEYLNGSRDDFALNVSLHDPLEAGFLAEDGGTSEFERAWGALDLTDTASVGLARTLEVPELEGLHGPLTVDVLTRVRAEGMPLEEAMAVVTPVYEAEPADEQVASITRDALGGRASVEELETLKTLLTTAYAVPAEPAQAVVDAVAAGAQPGEDRLTILLGGERDEALAWLEGELFGAVRELGAYLAGDADHFSILIRFDEYPELAPAIAGWLNSEPEALVREGFRLDDREIQRELDAGEDPPVESLDEARALFTTAGRTFDLRDFGPSDETTASGEGASTVSTAPGTPGGASAQGSADTAPGGGEQEGLPLDRIQPYTAAFATWARPAGILAVVVLAGLIGVLGGRRWWSRATWAAAAVLVPATALAIVTGPVYTSVASPRLAEAIGERQAELLADEGPTTALGMRALDQVQAIADGQAGALATEAGMIAGLALLLGALAVGLHVYRGRRASEDVLGEETGEPIVLPVAEPAAEDEARAA